MFTTMLGLCALACLPSRAFAYATFEINVTDADGVGFNDPTPVTSIGGNTATTLGAQRLQALEHAAALWGSVIDSAVPIVVDANWENLGCQGGSNVAALGGTVGLNFNIDGDGGNPDWVYNAALADRLMGEDQAPGMADVSISFNDQIGVGACDHTQWYYGLDAKPGFDLDMVDTALHELGHGLGVQPFVSAETGAEPFGVPDPFEANLRDLDQDMTWDMLDDAARLASHSNVRRVVWDGEHLQAATPGYLEAGAPLLTTTPDLGLSGIVGDAGYGARPLAMSVSAPLRMGNPLDGCSMPMGAAGAIVLLRPACRFSQVAESFQRFGALGVIFAVDDGGVMPPRSLEEDAPTPSVIPVLSIGSADAQLLEDALGNGPVTVEISADPAQLIGADTEDRLYMYATAPLTQSTMGHVDIMARPNMLMEPFTTPFSEHSTDITGALLRDLGWEPFCGNGRLDQEEECDDAEANNDSEPDACRGDCSAAGCGDGVLDSGETCDDGADNSDTLPDACRLDCQPARCGDGVLDDGEPCDDGADNSDSAADACRSDCALPTCGDGATDSGEECDSGDGRSDDTADACRLDCTSARCGDGVVDSGEACDDAGDNSDSEPDACRSDCQPASCGDGVVDADEACDEGADNSDSAPDACREDCSAPRCGDGVVDGDERCDGQPDCAEDCGVQPAATGDGAAAGGPDGAAGGGSPGDGDLEGGCGCHVPGSRRGSAPASPHATLLSMMLGLLLGARRRGRGRLRMGGAPRDGGALLGLAALLALLLASGCSGDSGGDGSRRARGMPADDLTSSAGGLDASAGDSDGPVFGNADAQPPQLPVPDGGFPDAMATADPGADPDDDSCGSVELEPMVNAVVEPGNLIVVFDNSGSMSSLWNDTPRWLAAGNAVRDAVSSLSEYLNVAAIIFPVAGGGCAVPSIDSNEQIRFLPGATFLQAWTNFMTQNSPGGGTPLGEGLQAADQALQMTTLTGATNVIVLTDGAPGCTTTALDTLPPAWLAQGIKTHVVGLPGSESAEVVLNNIAMGGGTMQHLTPDDPRSLRRQLAGIISETVSSALPSCTIPLDPPAPNPDEVFVVVSEGGMRTSAGRDLGTGGGWRIDDAGTEIEFFGIFCDKGLAGDYDRISIEFGCVDLPPLEPPVLE